MILKEMIFKKFDNFINIEFLYLQGYIYYAKYYGVGGRGWPMGKKEKNRKGKGKKEES